MSNRTWISSKQMFWNKDEWQEAMQHLNENEPQFNSMSAGDQVGKMIGYLMEEYPVDQGQLDKIKAKS
ncbi:hypothetical protein HYG86_12755 [Alkalicella caledoniensis]|uniref:Uncharacterized protein n=1 Tax=Alkalicella caledoniensis TaxID=2731377 RepID=A0A7G9WA66_ALKCA|nr:hypothetical protein [Alkalicella caledoniensis]QNO15578.1 hypothetical protein HYG86_12755 [Alkalicella caledoniensis]